MSDFFTPENLRAVHELKDSASRVGERLNQFCHHGLPIERNTKGVSSVLKTCDVWERESGPSMSVVWMADTDSASRVDSTLILIDYESNDIFRLRLDYDWDAPDQERNIVLLGFNRIDNRSWQDLVVDLLEADNLNAWEMNTVHRLQNRLDRLSQALSWRRDELNRNWEWEDEIGKNLKMNEEHRFRNPVVFFKYFYSKLRRTLGMDAPWQ